MPWYLGNSDGFASWGGIGLLMVWSGFWTGLALWHAAKRKEPWHFVFFFVFHTAGILEFLYLFFIAKIFENTHRKISKTKK